jgi:predicted ATPase/class 3 adenylate cyclase
MAVQMALPTGPAVTFLFTDIEGSTRLEQGVGTAAWSAIVGQHDELLRGAIEGAGGVVVKTEGDAFFAAFADPRAAVEAAIAAQRALAVATWPDACQVRVRMGAHIGEGRLRARAREEPEDYVGIDVNYAARIAAAGNGGQIVVSQALVDALEGLHPPDAAGVELADAGLHAVKDFEEPRRLRRIVVAGAADDDRPLRTLEAPSNLPGEVTDLVGREDEIERLSDVIDGNRIVTLTGPGGSGKTRLALGVAQAVRQRFPHGTWFVDLAAVRDPGMLEPTVASTLGLRDSPQLSLADALRAHLRDRTTLLVLDNLEQLLPPGADIVATIARGAPGVRFLVTSRELLRIGGEAGHPVPPLDPDAGVRLFEARATALRPDLALGEDGRDIVRQICERLFGLPLAIELAAARVRLLSPALILERLTSSLDLGGGSRDLPERQRTLRGAMAWSHELLSEPERRLFRRLSVFAGGWTAELAALVGDSDGTFGGDVLESLESLADKSLVRIVPAGSVGAGADEARFDLHPLLREYALEKLDESGEQADMETIHASVIADIAERAGARILSAAGSAAIGRLDLEQHNIRAALGWSTRTGETQIGLRIMGAIWRWFQQRGRLREARSTLAQLMANAAGDTRLRIAALAAEGGLAYWADDFDEARRAYEERLALADETGDAGLRADAHYDLGFMFMIAQDPVGLREHEEQALALYTEIGHGEGELRARQALVLAVFLSGDNALALELEAENLAAFRKVGSAYQIADSMTFHAGVYFKSGDPETAWGFMRDGLTWFAENENQSGIARALGMAAIVSLTDGDAELGARAAGATYEIVREKGVMLAPVRVLHLRDPREIAIERLGEARAEELMADGAALPIGEVIEQVLAAPAPRTQGTSSHRASD